MSGHRAHWLSKTRLRKRMIRFVRENVAGVKETGLKNLYLMISIQSALKITLPDNKWDRYRDLDLILTPLSRSTFIPPPISEPRRVWTRPAIDRRAFYDTDEWRRVRYQALKLHGGCCQCCGARGAPGKPLHVDHIKPRSRFPELELTVSNLQVLCPDCNLGKGAWDDTDWRDGAAA